MYDNLTIGMGSLCGSALCLGPSRTWGKSIQWVGDAGFIGVQGAGKDNGGGL